MLPAQPKRVRARPPNRSIRPSSEDKTLYRKLNGAVVFKPWDWMLVIGFFVDDFGGFKLKGRVDEIPRDRPVIAVCHSGRRSGQATVILREAGFAEVANLHGGMLLWHQMALPAELH